MRVPAFDIDHFRRDGNLLRQGYMFGGRGVGQSQTSPIGIAPGIDVSTVRYAHAQVHSRRKLSDPNPVQCDNASRITTQLRCVVIVVMIMVVHTVSETTVISRPARIQCTVGIQQETVTVSSTGTDNANAVVQLFHLFGYTLITGIIQGECGNQIQVCREFSGIVAWHRLCGGTDRGWIVVMVIPMPFIVMGVLYLSYTYYQAKQNPLGGGIDHLSHLIGSLYGIAFTVALKPEIVLHFLSQFMEGPRAL